MRVRYTINERGELEDRDGRVLGRLVALTLEEKGGTTGGVEVPSLQLQTFSEKRSEKTDGGVGETNAIDATIADVYAYWRQRRPNARQVIPKGTWRQLKRGAQAGYSAGAMKTMIDGLLASEWHRERPETLRLSTIFATKPGGKTFEDQLDYWLEKGSALPSPGQAEAPAPAIQRAKDALRYPDRDGAHEKATRFLEQHGWTVVWKVDRRGTPMPTFERA